MSWRLRELPAHDGVRLRVGRWAAGRPLGHCLLLQGRGDYLEKHADAAARLSRDGWEVVSLDWRGQGRSGRLGAAPGLADVASFDDHLADLELVLATEHELPGPRVLLTHSMGSLTGLLHLLGHPTAVPRAAMMSPMWGFTGAPPLPVVRAVSAGAVALGLGLRPAVGERPADPAAGDTGAEMATADPDGLRRLHRLATDNPDAVVHGSTWRWTRAAAAAVHRLRGADLSGLTTEVLVASSPRDGTVDVAEHRRVARRLPHARVRHYDGGHDLLFASTATTGRLWADVLNHLAGAREQVAT
jgi:lysophospholipase